MQKLLQAMRKSQAAAQWSTFCPHWHGLLLMSLSQDITYSYGNGSCHSCYGHVGPGTLQVCKVWTHILRALYAIHIPRVSPWGYLWSHLHHPPFFCTSVSPSLVLLCPFWLLAGAQIEWWCSLVLDLMPPSILLQLLLFLPGGLVPCLHGTMPLHSWGLVKALSGKQTVLLCAAWPAKCTQPVMQSSSKLPTCLQLTSCCIVQASNLHFHYVRIGFGRVLLWIRWIIVVSWAWCLLDPGNFGCIVVPCSCKF